MIQIILPTKMSLHKEKAPTEKDYPLNNYYSCSTGMRLELAVVYSARCGRENLTTV